MKRGVPLQAAAFAAGVLVLLAGCGSAPVVRLHSLVAADDAASARSAVAGASTAGSATDPPMAISLRVGAIPAQVDQPQWLVRQPDDTLLLLEQERWASPLRDELRAALLQTLTARYGLADAIGTAARWRVVVDVTRFESEPGREARLDANWSVAPGDAAAGVAPAASSPGSASATAPLSPAVQRCTASLREPVAAGAPALAEGHRRAVMALAAAIGDRVRALQADPLAPCAPGR